MESKRQRRLREARAKELNKLPAGKFIQIDLSKSSKAPTWMTRAFSNNRYIVMIDDECMTTKGFAIRAMIQKVDDTPIINHWSEIQKIKNEIFGAESLGIEYYPRESKLVDKHNIYWLWIFKDGIIPEIVSNS